MIQLLIKLSAARYTITAQGLNMVKLKEVMTASTVMFLVTRHLQFPCLKVGVTRALQLVAVDTIPAKLSLLQVLLWLRSTPILLTHWGYLKEVLGTADQNCKEEYLQ